MAKDRKHKQRDERENERRRNERARDLIRKFDDPVLVQICDPVNPGDDLDFLRTMRRACMATRSGVGLAAPQIGITKRAIFIWPYHFQKKQWWMLNPVIIAKSPDVDYEVEGCLSYPGYTGMVSRHTWIQVQYARVETGEALLAVDRTDTFRDWEARIIQHEIDHLDGICAVKNFWKPLLIEGK